MRLHTFTLVVFTAVLAHSANSTKTSNSTTTEGAPPASLRSSDACCDDVPVEQRLGPHETTAVEERMPEPWIPSSINSAVARLVEKLHAQYPVELAVENFPVNVLREFDENAIRHLFRSESAHMTTEQLPEHAQIVDRWLQNKLEKGPRLIAEARQVFLAHEAEMGATVHQDFFARQAEMGVETPQYFLSLQAEMTADGHQFILADQAQTLVKAHEMILKHQEIMIAKTRQDFLAHLEETTAQARRSFIGIEADLTAKAHKYVRAYVAKTTAQARDFFLANQAKMTAEARDSFLAHQAELTAKATQSFLANQARMTAAARDSFLANQAELTAMATQSFLAHQAKMTAQAHQSFLAHQAELTAKAHRYFLAHRAEMTEEARQSFLAHLAELTAKVDQSFLAQQAESGEEAIMRFEMHPSALFKIRLQQVKADAYKNGDSRKKNPIASLDLGSLDSYRRTYNHVHDSKELTLRKVMSRCIGDDAELASILSILNLNKKNKKYVATVRMEPVAEPETVEDAAVKLGIPPGTTGVLDDKNVETFVRFTAILARKHKDQHSVIVEQLTKRFGGRQAALLVYKMNWLWRASYTALKKALYEYLMKIGTTLDMLRDEIMKAREKRAVRPGNGGHMIEERGEERLLIEYSLYPEDHTNRKRKRASDTSAGSS
ncbi:unnamed protein product [Hyaloperonospora brassicae]|uniref:RxLR effector candidate protein n=1 Tax=Hyaloperonospora brassicae TaxID=162125 RepID=A0AAV0V1A3_HYABA|nr:unnamed protein product [Hyaloperonospora brassicae]